MEGDTALQVRTMSELNQEGLVPDILFWVGCAGSYDARAQKVSRALVSILQHAGISFAILGNEEMCTGDPARRAGNEFLFQSLALQNVQILNGYGIRKIVTACPQCFNTLKNEYPDCGGQ
jgi:Fe-S oxidoreductase